MARPRIIAVGLCVWPVVANVLYASTRQHFCSTPELSRTAARSVRDPSVYPPCRVVSCHVVLPLTVPSMMWVTRPFVVPFPNSYMTAVLFSSVPGTVEVSFSRPKPFRFAHS